MHMETEAHRGEGSEQHSQDSNQVSGAQSPGSSFRVPDNPMPCVLYTPPVPAPRLEIGKVGQCPGALGESRLLTNQKAGEE